ncbi:hypothetical protein CASFOL_039093 [Castilleja foliolosa]|uniref:Uncharacterized protein n=1 Tax=Castilleja foliolosa TaxID=1961234 RepID=A0ABD3BHL2_9LAMI
MKDVIIKYNLGKFGPAPHSSDVKIDELTYVIDHVEDFTKLRELLESKYGSDPNVVAILFEKISKFQLDKRRLGRSLIPGKKAMISVAVSVEGPSPPVCGVFAVKILDE